MKLARRSRSTHPHSALVLSPHLPEERGNSTISGSQGRLEQPERRAGGSLLLSKGAGMAQTDHKPSVCLSVCRAPDCTLLQAAIRTGEGVGRWKKPLDGGHCRPGLPFPCEPNPSKRNVAVSQGPQRGSQRPLAHGEHHCNPVFCTFKHLNSEHIGN